MHPAPFLGICPASTMNELRVTLLSTHLVPSRDLKHTPPNINSDRGLNSKLNPKPLTMVGCICGVTVFVMLSLLEDRAPALVLLLLLPLAIVSALAVLAGFGFRVPLLLFWACSCLPLLLLFLLLLLRIPLIQNGCSKVDFRKA